VREQVLLTGKEEKEEVRRALGTLVLALVACHHGALRPNPVPILEGTPALPALYDVIVPKRVAPGGAASGETSCGTRMVIRERGRNATRVTVDDESFWVDDADLERAPKAEIHCFGPLVIRDLRVSDALARSLTPPVLTTVDAWPDFDSSFPKSIFHRDEHDTTCVELEFRSGHLTGRAIDWGFDREKERELSLTGPTIKGVKMVGDNPFDIRPAPGEQVHFLCLKSLFMARRTKDYWDLVRRNANDQDIWAYSPAEAERWYATRAACEKGLERGAVAKVPFTGCM
jgi:hypothetical protein